MSTIVAISTSPGIGGIGIIRMSGEDCFEILDKIFIPKNKSKIKGYSMKYGNIVDNFGNVVDEVLVSYFIAPKSYTTENMCEINSHGGTVIMNKILDICLKNGAILAEPGEFTKKAFLNGRIDLSQAEAVIDIINSKTDKESKVAVEQLEGNLSKKLKEIRQKVVSILADIEVTIDYPEYDVEEVTKSKISDFLKEIDKLLDELEKSFYNGKILKEGVKVAIIGKPNAGKSSLLNLILKEERAIVTDIAGTTRDSIEEFISIDGIPLKIIDTAGIRNANDVVEKIGVEKSLKISDESDMVLAIFDISKEIDEEDKKILEIIKDKKAIIILNKIDLEKRLNTTEIKKTNKPIIEISAKNNVGVEELYNEISKMFKLNEIAIDGELIISNNRHKSLIINARNNLKKAQEIVEKNMPIDIISSYLKEIIEELGKITGESVTEDVLNEIFSKFCLGK
jgi:tRNA modification GTPase